MIGRLQGTIVEIIDNQLIVDVQGVGYLVNVPDSTAIQCTIGQTALLHIHTAVREDAITLYGFNSLSDKKLFELVTSVSGIGPRIGLNILSTYSGEQIETAISTGQSTAFTAVSGIGKKNAERIILELKNKVTPSHLTADLSPNPENDQLGQALAGLGYNGAEIAVVSQKIDASLSLSDQIKQALKLMNEHN